MRTEIEKRKPYNFNVAIITGYIGIISSFIVCMNGIYSIYFKSNNYQDYNLIVIFLNLFVLICAFLLVYNYKKFMLVSGGCLVVLALVLICFFMNYYSGLLILLSGFFGTVESMYKTGSSFKGYSYLDRQNTIYEARRNFHLFMPEI